MLKGISNGEVNNAPNVTIIQRANTKSSVGQHGPLKNAKVGSGAMEELASSVDRSHPPCALVEIRYMGLPIVKISMETTV
jgi:hypothetical protein